MVEMIVESIRVSLMNAHPVVVLKEKNASRLLPIWIGRNEADAIAMRIQGIVHARPLTHDLIVNAIKALGGSITHILINDLAEDVFFARIVLDLNGQHVEVDARSSDAINVAVRAEVPIYVDEQILNRAAISGDIEESEEPGSSKAVSPEPIAPPKEEELQSLSAFKDFISSLDLDKLDKPRST